MIHHIAIATPNLQIMSAFYKSLPGLYWKEDKFTENGGIRSVWLETYDHCLIMLEAFPYSKGPEALVFQMEISFNINLIMNQVTNRTDFTIYFLDPDGNKLGYSSYPEKLNI